VFFFKGYIFCFFVLIKTALAFLTDFLAVTLTAGIHGLNSRDSPKSIRDVTLFLKPPGSPALPLLASPLQHPDPMINFSPSRDKELKTIFKKHHIPRTDWNLAEDQIEIKKENNLDRF
jgi:hypothetical protein